MRNRKTKLFAILLCFLATGVVLAQVSENYDLSWNVIGGGGGATSSANYVMRSTVGQIIGLSSSDNYQLGAGYRNGISAVPTPTPTPTKFDTGPGTYPSIFGTHNGTIKANQTITVNKLYTYPCVGTGGHSEYVKIWNGSGTIAEERWKGYQGDWHYIIFPELFTLVANETYNYTIRTGSYPQIIHAKSKEVTGGTINCTEFLDANGNFYHDWIPAVRLE